LTQLTNIGKKVSLHKEKQLIWQKITTKTN